jgi:SAM-dependent methyltransferase
VFDGTMNHRSSDPAAYGDAWAEIYDKHHATRPDIADPRPAVDFLARLSGPGPALELGIGTGRVALPLAARGVDVHGIEASVKMVEQLCAKPRGAAIPVTVGDLADVDVPGTYRLVFAVFNTFFALPDQDAQVRCFVNVARHLAEDGAFVLEVFVPDVASFKDGQSVQVNRIESSGIDLVVATHDPLCQQIDSRQVLIAGDRARILPVFHRYAWPSELDLMARHASLRLSARWGGWEYQPFESSSRSHVSVYVPMKP